MQDALDGETAAAELNAAMQMREAGDFRAAALRMQELRKQAHTELEATRLALLEANCWTSAGDVRRARQLLDDAECFASQDRSLKLVLEHEIDRLERVLGQRQRALERTERIQEDFK